MFLIRIAFWGALIVLLLPTDKGQQEKLYVTATETVHRISTFCDRNAALCERGSAYWTVFKQKLEFGAKLAIDVASERLMGQSEAVQPAAAPVSASPPARVERAKGTLSPTDVVPEWRGKTTKNGA